MTPPRRPKRAGARRGGGGGSANSNVGLIVALIFFVLLSIGLGVGTYTGYYAADGKDQEIKKLKDDRDVAEKDRDWYRFQSHLYLAYMGHLTKPEDWESLNGNRKKFVSNDPSERFGDPNERNVVLTLMTQLEKKMPWINPADPKQPALQLTYEKLLQNLETDFVKREDRIKALENDKAALEAKVNDLDKQLVAAKDDYDKKLDALKDKLKNDTVDLLAKKNELLQELEKYGKDNAKLKEDMAAADARSRKEATELRAKATMLQQREEERQREIAQLKRETDGAPKDWRTDWKIISVDAKTKMAFINLGERDNVKPQLTFSIHGIDPSGGTPLPQSKGTLEVVRVDGPNSALARITSLRDGLADPILTGDVLFNPTWSPTRKRHVAIAGIIDLTGDGRDSIQEFIRNLERQNIVVDAYLNMKDGMLLPRGIDGMNINTEYLILGDELKPGQVNVDEETLKKIQEMKDAMRSKAKEDGVTIIGLNKYLELSGYRLPRNTTDQPSFTGSYGNTRNAPGEAPR